MCPLHCLRLKKRSKFLLHLHVRCQWSSLTPLPGAPIKIYPPAQLPDRNVTETQLNIWQEELEVYLMQEKDFAVFIEGGAYDKWESQESNKDRILNLKAEDTVQVCRSARRLPDHPRDRDGHHLRLHLLRHVHHVR